MGKEPSWENINELLNLKLSPIATLNVWCGMQVYATQTMPLSEMDADKYQTEKWALYDNAPHHHKINAPQ